MPAPRFPHAAMRSEGTARAATVIVAIPITGAAPVVVAISAAIIIAIPVTGAAPVFVAVTGGPLIAFAAIPVTGGPLFAFIAVPAPRRALIAVLVSAAPVIVAIPAPAAIFVPIPAAAPRTAAIIRLAFVLERVVAELRRAERFAALMRIRFNPKDVATARALAEQAAAAPAPTALDRIAKHQAQALLIPLRSGDGRTAALLARKLLPFGRL